MQRYDVFEDSVETVNEAFAAVDGFPRPLLVSDVWGLWTVDPPYTEEEEEILKDWDRT